MYFFRFILIFVVIWEKWTFQGIFGVFDKVLIHIVEKYVNNSVAFCLPLAGFVSKNSDTIDLYIFGDD